MAERHSQEASVALVTPQICRIHSCSPGVYFTPDERQMGTAPPQIQRLVRILCAFVDYYQHQNVNSNVEILRLIQDDWIKVIRIIVPLTDEL